MDGTTANDIIDAVKELVDQLAPDVRYVPKYGGEVLVLDPDNDNKFVGGVFTSKDHVSLEFSVGASFDDPDGHLEGKGKNRRHLKFQAVADVVAKDARGFLTQAFDV